MNGDAIFVALNEADFSRLVAGLPVVCSVAGHRLEIRQEGISARGMLAAIIEAMGDDPPEAREFLPLKRRGRPAK